jgi:benzoate-CoA ligase family protein
MLVTRDYAYLLDDSGARAIVVDGALVPQIAPIRDELRDLRHVIVAGESDGAPGTLRLADLIAEAPAHLAPADTRDDDMCFWQYSSGTTGAPKAVIHLQRSALAPADLHGRHVVAMRPDDRVYSVARLFFSYGLNNSLVIPFRHRATAILEPARPEPRVVFETIARERPTVFYGVPTSYAALLAHDAAPDVSSVRVWVSAGEALPKPVFERWKQRFGGEILDGIGSTEIGYIAISNIAGRVRPGTSGEVIPGYEARVVDADGDRARSGEVGDLIVRGPSTALGYWRNRTATKRTFRGEWILTGDRYVVDADGYFTFQGRGDDLLKVGGVWVSPLEIEAALLEHEAVRECAVVPRHDDDGLVKPVAFVVLREGYAAGDVDVRNRGLGWELRQFVKERLAPYKYPRWIEFVNELPKTSTGKIQRFKLRTAGARRPTSST